MSHLADRMAMPESIEYTRSQSRPHLCFLHWSLIRFLFTLVLVPEHELCLQGSLPELYTYVNEQVLAW